jgi:hypothetical protein
MASIVAFPILAFSMRSGSTPQALDLIKHLARSVDVAVQAKKSNTPQPMIHSIKEDLIRSRHAKHVQDGQHIPDRIEIEEIFDRVHIGEMFTFILTNAAPEILTEPTARTGNTPAQEWLVKCALHSTPNLPDEFTSLWTSYLSPQPSYTAPPFNRVAYLSRLVTDTFAEHAVSSTFPGLQHALHMLPADDTEAQHLLLREYWRLGATVSALWEHMWEEHGTPRGQALSVSNFHLDSARLEVRLQLRRGVRDWASATPLRVRQVLAQCDMEADLVFLANHVFPLVIAPVGSGVCEGEFGWLIFGWINHVAMKAGMVLQDEAFASFDDAPLFFRPHGIEEYLFYRGPEAPADPEDEVELELVGPAIDVLDYAHVPLRLPLDETCTICMEKFWTDEANLCALELQACGHIFHGHCLERWVNTPHVTLEVACPNCRAKICDARPRRVPWP